MNYNLDKKRRYEWIDLLRFIAIFNVLVCHSVQMIYGDDINYLSSMSFRTKIFHELAFSAGRIFGVPIFLMITGYLLLSNKYDGEATSKFWKNNLLHLFFCTIIWFFIYDIFLILCCRINISVDTIIKDILFLHKVDMIHVWYMPMIIGMYLFIPFISKALEIVDNPKVIAIVVLYVFVVFSVIPFANLLLITNGREQLFSQFNGGCSGGIYGLYIIIGWIIKKYNINIKHSILITIIIISYLATVLIQLYFFIILPIIIYNPHIPPLHPPLY